MADAAFEFSGTERVTIELAGTFEPDALQLPADLRFDLAEGRARVSVFAFWVDGIRMTGVPLLRSSYAEVLWRVAVRAGDEPGWWVAACDLAAWGASWAARRWVRYPVRACAVEVTSARIGVRTPAAAFTCELGAPGAPAAIESRVLYTGPSWRVPWGDDGTGAQLAPVRVEADSLAAVTLGRAVDWAATATIRHGRAHRCGRAVRR